MNRAGGLMALHRWFHCFGCGSRYFEAAFVLQFPDEGAEFACDGDNAFGVTDTTRPQCAVAFTQSVLHAPREGFDFLALPDLPGGEGSTDFGRTAEVLGTFHQHPADVGVAAFGDASLPPF